MIKGAPKAVVHDVLRFTRHVATWFHWQTTPPAVPTEDATNHEARAREYLADINAAFGYDLVAHGRTTPAALACAGASEKSDGGQSAADGGSLPSHQGLHGKKRGERNRQRVEAFYATYPASKQTDCARILGLGIMAVGRHVRDIRRGYDYAEGASATARRASSPAPSGAHRAAVNKREDIPE